MYAKVINPKTNGSKVYNNQGSSLRTVNYLAREAKENGEVAAFFGAPGRAEQSVEEVVAALDGNVKGLGRDAAKFYSLVLSPSPEELRQIGDDRPGLERYTQRMMEVYAQNFMLTKARRSRKLTFTLSCRPATPPSASRSIRWVRPSVSTGYSSRPRPPSRQGAAANKWEKKPLTSEQLAAKDTRLDGQVARVNSKLSDESQLDPARVRAIAKERAYDNVFYQTLGKIARNAENGVHPPDPYQYLTTGRVTKVGVLHMSYHPKPDEWRRAASGRAGTHEKERRGNSRVGGAPWARTGARRAAAQRRATPVVLCKARRLRPRKEPEKQACREGQGQAGAPAHNPTRPLSARWPLAASQ